MRRIQILFLLFVFAILAIIVRLFYIQILTSEKYSTNAYLQTSTISPSRGSIVDRNGEPFVINQASYLLYAEPQNIEDDSNLLDDIEDILHIGEATLEARFDKEKLWIPLARDLNDDQRESIEKLNYAGLGFEENFKRFYPEASIAAHLVGFVGKDDEGDSIGYFGVEGFYNKDLEGLPGILKTERDALGRPIVIGTQDRLKGEDGRELVLTIDKTTQSIIKRKIVDGVKRYEAVSGCITVMDPQTGEILGMSCVPDFDPSEYFLFTEKEFRNPVITDAFEPGSIFKPLIVAAAIEEGVIDADDSYNEEGPIKIGGYYIRTWNDQYNGKINISRILETSSNVGMVHIGEKLGNEKILEYLELYGFGNKTGIDLQGEVASSVRKESQWYPIDYATVTFGQGIATTQIQMLNAFAPLVNGGWIMKPHVVSKLVSENGEVKEIQAKKIRQVLSQETSNEIKNMLQRTVENGEAKWKIPQGYAIGGKTGTAQIALEGTYDASKTNASFIGFAPVHDPQFLVLVTLHQPAASPWASETAAPLFFDVARDLLVEYNISPE